MFRKSKRKSCRFPFKTDYWVRVEKSLKYTNGMMFGIKQMRKQKLQKWKKNYMNTKLGL